MVTIFKKTLRDKELRVLKNFSVGTWVHLEEPSSDELDWVVDELKVDDGHLKDALDIYEVPRLETEGETLYIFTRVPYLKDSLVFTTPLLFVLSDTFILTVSKNKVDLFDKFESEKVKFFTTQKINLFIQFFREINTLYNSSLTRMSRNIYNVSLGIEKVNNKQIQDLVLYEQTLNDYLNGLLRTSTILNNLLSGKMLQLYTEDREMVEDLFLANEQLVMLAKNSLQSAKNIRDAYSAILTNNLNRVIKLLTALTIILTIPTMIASFFGMNVDLPIPDTSVGFWLISGGALSLSLLLLWVFFKNDWM